MANRMPVVFVGHGSPMNAIEDNGYSRAWTALGDFLEKPKAILSLSAHWFTRGTKVNIESAPSMIYDMYGFPEELYRVQYPAPGSPDLAREVQKILGDAVSVDNHWGIDHGAWSVLRRVFPSADIPLLPFSINAELTPAEHYALGQKLKPLREEGILIFGSGNVVHNLARVDWRNPGGTSFAQEFDQYIFRAVTTNNFEDVIGYDSNASISDAAKFSVPTADHFSPLLYVLGASDPEDNVSVFNQECVYGSLSMTSYLFGRDIWNPQRI